MHEVCICERLEEEEPIWDFLGAASRSLTDSSGDLSVSVMLVMAPKLFCSLNTKCEPNHLPLLLKTGEKIKKEIGEHYLPKGCHASSEEYAFL